MDATLYYARDVCRGAKSNPRRGTPSHTPETVYLLLISGLKPGQRRYSHVFPGWRKAGVAALAQRWNGWNKKSDMRLQILNDTSHALRSVKNLDVAIQAFLAEYCWRTFGKIPILLRPKMVLIESSSAASLMQQDCFLFILRVKVICQHHEYSSL